MPTNKTLEQRFWAKVQKGSPAECWLWTGSKVAGYGRITVNGRLTRAHRLSWEMHNGKSIPDGAVACHLCDTPACVNPHHIWVGTQADNLRDMHSKGRAADRFIGGKTKSKDELLADGTCPQGHEYRVVGFVTIAGRYHYCRACRNQSLLKNYHNRKHDGA